jgi:hypothetical protein
MAQALRFEKSVPANPKTSSPAFVAYVEFQTASGNSVTRLWNVIKKGRPFQMKENERHQSQEELKSYVKNMRKFYEDQGFKAVSGDWLAETSSSAKASKVKAKASPASTKAPVASRTPGLGELPAGVKENVSDEPLPADALTE